VQMKIMFSVILIASLMLLSSCELGTGGKAITTGEPQWTPLYICFEYQAGDRNMWDFFSSADPNCNGKEVWKSSSGVPGTMGYVSKTPFTGSVLISECMRTRTETIRNVFKTKIGEKKYNDRYTIQGKNCPEGSYSHEIGYVYASQTPGTSALYRCWMDRMNEGIWDHWLSFDSKCTSSRIGEVKQEGIYGYVPRTAATPAVPIATTPMPTLTACDQLKATNSDLNTKITRLKEENALMEQTLSTIGGQ